MQTAPTRVSPAQDPSPSPRKKRRTSAAIGTSVSKHTVLIVLSVMFALPLVWMVGTSFKTAQQALQLPVVWWPQPLEWRNYPDLFAALPYFRFFLNTFLYAGITIVGVCISSSLVAYGFSRLRWAGRDAVFYAMLITLILPFVCTLIPLFVMYKRFGWIGSYLPLGGAPFFGSPGFRPLPLPRFFLSIPRAVPRG